ncbi:MAG: hypothetical protein JSW34_03705 [Candidatus Zixiibacteriota bacterium]|nr:MAG: hypothetical protein JSW34_03705 [candidate division Zixibacteria bacterium]
MNRRNHITVLRGMIVIALILLLASVAYAQEDTTEVVTFVGKSVERHPDGAVGTVSFHGLLQYGRVNKGAGVSGPHIQKYDFGLNWVVDHRVSLNASFMTIDEDTLRYESTVGLRLFSRHPSRADGVKNPDGPAFGPVLTLGVGIRHPSLAVETSRMLADLGLAVPLSRYLTVSAGYRYFEEIEEVDVAQVLGGVNIYLSRYSADSAYTNPDGPAGQLAVSLAGGGSKNGFFGDLTLLFPINNNLTWKLNIRGERIESPYRRTAFGGVGFSFYPAN